MQLVPATDDHAILPLPEPGTFTIGRKDGCTLIIPHKKVSGKHCELLVEQRDGVLQVLVTDLSTNGTFVNGAQIAKGGRIPLQLGSTHTFANPDAQATYAEMPLFTLVVIPPSAEVLHAGEQRGDEALRVAALADSREAAAAFRRELIRSPERASDANKRAPGPYMRFCKFMRPKLLQQMPMLSFGEVGKAIGRQWNLLHDDQRAEVTATINEIAAAEAAARQTCAARHGWAEAQEQRGDEALRVAVQPIQQPRQASPDTDPFFVPKVNERVRVWWPSHGVAYDGRVADVRCELQGSGTVQCFQVAFDDGDRRWHVVKAGESVHGDRRWHTVKAGESVQKLAEPVGADVTCVDSVPLELRCALTHQRLTDPGKLSRCAHPPRCNVEDLRQFVSRTKTCPIAGCMAPLARSRDVERNAVLGALLCQLPLSTTVVWLRGDAVHTKPPAGAAAAVGEAPRKRFKRARPDTLIID